jgi:hypothetical protein
MTQEEWIKTRSISEMLAFLAEESAGRWQRFLSWTGLRAHPTSVRKMQLFATACCRGSPIVRRDAEYRSHLAQIEAYADGAVPRVTMGALIDSQQQQLARLLEEDFPRGAILGAILLTAQIASSADGGSPPHAAQKASKVLEMALTSNVMGGPSNDEEVFGDGVERWGPRIDHCELLREVVGGPFFTPAVDSQWFVPPVIAVAQSAYEGDYAAFPVLADALEEAGCSHSHILDHLRESPFHCRGCWAVDLVLRKS